MQVRDGQKVAIGIGRRMDQIRMQMLKDRVAGDRAKSNQCSQVDIAPYNVA